MPHVLVAGSIHEKGLILLRQSSNITFDYVEEVSEESYAPLIGRADALLIRTQPLTASTIAAANSLQIVSRHGVGYDSVDLDALNARRIALTIVGDVNSVSVAEHAMMMMFVCAKRAHVADQAVRGQEWGWRNRCEARELNGKGLLIIGYGRIGRHLARMAAGFGLKVRAYDPMIEPDRWPKGDVHRVPHLATGLAWADFVSVHAPKGDRELIGAREFAVMKPSAIVINTARGGVVNEAALLAALNEHRIAGAGLDVFETEPPLPDHPLFKLDQVFLSPHIAGLTAECAERMAVSSVQNILNFFDSRVDPALVVNAAFIADQPDPDP